MICGERGASRNSLFNPKNQSILLHSAHTYAESKTSVCDFIFKLIFFQDNNKMDLVDLLSSEPEIQWTQCIDIISRLISRARNYAQALICLVCWHVHIAIYIKLQNKKFHHSIYSKCFINQQRNKKKKSESFFSPANYPPYKTPDQPQG